MQQGILPVPVGDRYRAAIDRTGDTRAKRCCGEKKPDAGRNGLVHDAGKDFQETYSPVARSTSIRLLAALAAEWGLQIYQMDVVTACLNSELKEDIFMEVPEQPREVLTKIVKGNHVGSGTEIIRRNDVMKTAERWLTALNQHPDSVCLLKKALYGLKQSGLQWYRRLATRLVELGMQPTGQDPCMFISQAKHFKMIIAIYVDDILVATNNTNRLKQVK